MHSSKTDETLLPRGRPYRRAASVRALRSRAQRRTRSQTREKDPGAIRSNSRGPTRDCGDAGFAAGGGDRALTSLLVAVDRTAQQAPRAAGRASGPSATGPELSRREDHSRRRKRVAKIELNEVVLRLIPQTN